MADGWAAMPHFMVVATLLGQWEVLADMATCTAKGTVLTLQHLVPPCSTMG
uniref:Uncharacterized protein n=1 Tax=Rhizophora mucronata TaxID=61149 RepID=A0A2P2QTU7_RHIMU